MPASLIEISTSIHPSQTRVRDVQKDIVPNHSRNRKSSIPPTTDGAEDAEIVFIRNVAIVWTIIALSPLVLLHFVYLVWQD
ncbi:hypothetical protein HG15A2_28780 [Adhaeretor mobilis]|uniref:Uncharacterized protein n=1 Tax=Adhaeretor mobilis TaxID=1930276 RepID=A0A517MXE8_9BACT|nr:hypothetical protein HG15A2_28780 [Adhaeretor mobilis]